MHRLGLTTAVVAILVLPTAGCSGSEGTPGTTAAKSAKTEAPASASPAGRRGKASEKSLKQVENDVRFATAPEGELHMQKRHKRFCNVHATTPTLKILDRTAFEAIVDRLQTRGWTPMGSTFTGDDPSDGVNYTKVESGKWEISLTSGSVPPEFAEVFAPNQGTVITGISWSCTPD